MGFVDHRAGIRGAHPTGIDPTMTGVEKHRQVPITLGRSERHTGARREGSSIERLRPRLNAF